MSPRSVLAAVVVCLGITSACTAATDEADVSAPVIVGSTVPETVPFEEPSNGTDISVTLPATPVAAGTDLSLPVSVSVDASESSWSSALVEIESTGALVTSQDDLDLSNFGPGDSQQGTLNLQVPTAAEGELVRSVVNVKLNFTGPDGEPTNTRLTQVAVLADSEKVWLGFGSVADLERSRLEELLAAGEISQSEYDEAREATVSVVTGTVEVSD